jgi:hypothetical protein
MKRTIWRYENLSFVPVFPLSDPNRGSEVDFDFISATRIQSLPLKAMISYQISQGRRDSPSLSSQKSRPILDFSSVRRRKIPQSITDDRWDEVIMTGDHCDPPSKDGDYAFMFHGQALDRQFKWMLRSIIGCWKGWSSRNRGQMMIRERRLSCSGPTAFSSKQ